MQKVSTAYKNSMKSALRERSYIMVSFGLVNREAQSGAEMVSGGFNYFSKKSTIFSVDGREPVTYATLEQNFTKVDGSMYFPPRERNGAFYLDTGLTTKDFVSESSTFEIRINLHMIPDDVKGLTIQFGDNYPVDFDIIGSTGQKIAITGNTQAKFVTEQVIENTDSLTLVVKKMLYSPNRLRIYNILFGYGLVYTNDDVIDSTMDTYVSPISETVPQIDFSVTVKNYDGYFDVNNPNSAIHFFETGQEMDVYYGYQLPDSEEIEWIKGNHLLCSDWEADDTTATIRCVDAFRNLDNEYYKGLRQDNKSLYEYAVDIFEDAGISSYHIDPVMKSKYSGLPIPPVTHKEALQIIANSGQCSIFQNRDGVIQLISSYKQEQTANSNTEASYSNISNILNDNKKDEYAFLGTDYTTVDGTMYFPPRSLVSSINTGFVSQVASDETGTFGSAYPYFWIDQEYAQKGYGIKISFGGSLPSRFSVVAYNNGTRVDSVTVEKRNIEKITNVDYEFEPFTRIVVTFYGTKEPNNRIVVNHVELIKIGFSMEKTDMLPSVNAIKQELVKEVVVPYSWYSYDGAEEKAFTEDGDFSENEERTYYVNDSSHDFRATLDGSEDGVTITEWGNYYVRVKITSAGKHKLEILCKKYVVATKEVVKNINNRGKTVLWENPLVNNITRAEDLANWLADYYSAQVEYEYDTRGNPELDAGDTIYQENAFVDDLKVNVYQHTVKFNGALSGHVVARRMEG